jgi:general secretion pathway protein L
VAEQVLVRFALERPDYFEWLITDKKGNPTGAVGRGVADQLADACRKRSAILLLPAVDVLLTRVRLPARNAAAIAKALPYALEEQLADDVEELHFVRGPQDAQGNMPVAVIQQQRLERYLEILDRVQVRPMRIYPEALMLPWQDECWSVLIEDDQVLLRTGLFQGMGLEADNLLPVLNRLLEEQEGRPQLQLWASGESEVGLQQLEEAGFDTSQVAETRAPLELLASGFSGAGQLDLLQGLGDRRDVALGAARTWWVAAAMLVLALGVQMGGMGYGHWLLQQQEQELDKQVETLFRDTFPEVKRLVNARAQADQKLAELRGLYGGGGDAFLGMLYVSGEELSRDASLKLTGMNFKGGVLQLMLTGKDLSQFEELKQRLEQRKDRRLEVKILSALSREEGVDARLQIKEQAS